MSDEGETAKSPGRDRALFGLVAIILIANFIWRLLVPAHELPLRAEQVMTMGFDAVLIVVLVRLKSRVPQLRALFWVALCAGIGLFVLRFTNSDAWWSGHLMFSLR